MIESQRGTKRWRRRLLILAILVFLILLLFALFPLRYVDLDSEGGLPSPPASSSLPIDEKHRQQYLHTVSDFTQRSVRTYLA